MQLSLPLAAIFASVAFSAKVDSNPLGTTIQLLDELTTKIVADGEAEHKAYKEYFEWCDDVSANTKYEIKTATALKGKLEAKIGEESSNIDEATSKIEDTASAIAENEKELKAATEIRDKEHAEFAVAQKELEDAIDSLDRAINILSREMAKNPAALAQIDTSSMKNMLNSISIVVDAAGLTVSDQKTLMALVQGQQSADDDDAGAPAAAVYKTHSTNIFDVLEDLKEKAEGELSSLRKAESNSAHNFQMLKQSLDDQVANDNKNMAAEKSFRAECQESKAGAEHDLGVTEGELKAADEKLATAQSNCMTVSADHEATVAARDEELKTIAEAKKILVDTSSGAVEQTYSFVQISSTADARATDVVNLVKRLASQQHSAALAQLASRIAAVVKFGGANRDDVFGKVKGLISNLIAKLEKEADADATEKAYCDEQMAKTEAKKSDLDDTIAKLTAKIDQAAARSASLKEEVAELQTELAALAKEQAQMDKIRQEEHADYVTAKADLELGLGGVRKALSVLRDYYAADAAMLQQPEPPRPAAFSKAEGAASSIIGILEVVESDFATNLAKEESEEAEAASAYEKTTQENKVTVATKDQDVKYKTQESTGLDKSISELSVDRASANTELDAVMEYYGKIKERCIAKPETYEERRKRRESEITGLKEALNILENDTAFLQHKRRGSIRGSLSTE
jgi:chromosome segregation ATPase